MQRCILRYTSHIHLIGAYGTAEGVTNYPWDTQTCWQCLQTMEAEV